MTQLVKVKNTGHVPLVLEVCERDDAGAPSREIMILRPEEESYWIPLIEDRREVKIVENVGARR